MKRSFFVAISCLIFLFRLSSQSTFPSNGAPHNAHTLYALTNANIYTDYETLIHSGILLVRNGKVVNAGEKIDVPANAVIIDLKGKYIYPAFIDLCSDYGVQLNTYPPKSNPGPQMESSQRGAYGWNMAIRSSVNANILFLHNNDAAEDLRKNGFGSVVTFNRDGIVRGTGALVNLCSGKKENESVISDRAAAFYSFDKGSSSQDYPSSLTGAIALLRQTYYDAQWYGANKNRTEYNISLEKFNELQPLPAIFEANDKYNCLRAQKIGKEFNVKYIIKAGGNEYQRITDIQATFLKYILPLNFPEAYDVEDPFDAEGVRLADLKHWELAPTNPAAFEKNNI